ncbi:uncharacterized protein AB9X84_005287 [Acanthopagrus schlegelii]
MACTTQSASEYIRSARPHLVRELKNLSVIVENLYQQRVFSDEEVSEIEAEKHDFDKTRNILDSVTKKGEAACYEFLKIIDMTRKRTLGRNMHHWISCFPFREDTEMDTNYLQGSKPCHQYQAKLKSKAQKISNEFWKSNKNLFGEKKSDLSYTSLVLDTEGSPSPSKIKKFKSKKSKMSRPKKMKTYIPEDRSEMSPTKLLALNEDILLVGKPGIGKTALSHELLKLWAERDSKNLDYMFYFDMRETSHIMTDLNLEDLLFNVFSEPDEGKEEVLEDIKKNSDSVTIIFDGVTDLSSSVVQRIVKKDLLPHAKVIITCRPDDEEDFFCGGNLRVEVKGFSEQSVRTYMAQTLGEEQGNVLRNVELLTLCHVPMYALMVAACFSSQTPEDSPQPNSITEIYINIVRFCLQINSNKTKKNNLNSFISNKREEILSLAEAAFHATEGKTVNLTEFQCEDSCVLSFLKPLVLKVALTETKTIYAFHHYTMQEFFAALWLLKNPDKIKDVFQQCLTEEKKHMKHLIPFMCRLLTDKSPSLMKCLIPDQQLKSTTEWFFKEMINTFSPQLCKKDGSDSEDSGLDVDILFYCQCLYESQSPEACLYFLDRLDYDLDLSGQSLSPFSCCSVNYVVTQSSKRKIRLNLEGSELSEQGMRRLFGCLQNVQCSRRIYRGLRLQEQDRCCGTPERKSKQLLLDLCLKAALDKGESFHNVVKTLFSLFSVNTNLNNILLDFYQHIVSEGSFSVIPKLVTLFQSAPAVWSINLSERKSSILLEVLKLTSEKKQVKLTGCSHEESEVRSFLQCLPHISQLSFVAQLPEPSEEIRFFGNLLCAAADREHQTGEKILELLSSVCTYQTFSLKEKWWDFLLDLYSYDPETGLRVLPSLQSVFQSAPAVWSINLSERKSSILLEVLKLTSEKKQVELTGCSHEEIEVRSFLQCLPHISQLSFMPHLPEPSEEIRFFGNLLCAAADREHQTGEKILELLSSVCRYQTFPLKEKWCDFLLDLYSYDPETGLRVLPSLQSVFQSAPAVWSINLSERKSSILLEVLKLTSEKKQVKLTGCSHEESEVRSFLQCLPHISQLSVSQQFKGSAKFFGNLFCAAAERKHQTGEKILELLSSVCTYQKFPLNYIYDEEHEEDQSGFLLDLYSHVKDYETETGLRVLPSLQSVFQSVPAVWSINLSERKSSILLEVLKLTSEKKQVKLTGCSHEESEVRSFLQWLPHISQLSFMPHLPEPSEEIRFFGNLLCAAADREHQTGEKILELLSSVCRYQTFSLKEKWYDFLLDLYSYDPETGLRVLPSLQSVFQSAPAVWSINLSERKSSILLEVLKLTSEKKQVKLTGCSHEESEVRSFLQCLPHISQLSFVPDQTKPSEEIRFFGNLLCAAAEREQQTGEKILELLSSVCRYQTFPLKEKWCDFLLDLYSYDPETVLRVLPSLQSVFQSAPAVWSINLSERKSSILLEVLKLTSEKKQVKLTGCSHEESEVRSFLQWLPHISKLSVSQQFEGSAKFFGNLFCAAAERKHQTGEKILELLSSVCTYQKFPLNYIYDEEHEEYQSGFLLDLYSHVKDYETETGLRVLPSLQSVFQSAPAVWSINLSERKSSILLEVLKLTSEKKQVKLTGCSHEESEVRSFLQWLPHISQLSVSRQFKGSAKFFGNLFCAAAERKHQTGEKILELLSSVCTYQKFPLNYIYDEEHEEYQCGFLLDLYSHVKDYETETGLRVLPSLQSVFQSAPAVWSINLSERKSSILLEVLKLTSEKKQVKLTGCSHEESEVRSFLQWLPHISQLSVSRQFKGSAKFFGNLFCAAAEREQQTGEKILELLSSVCRYQKFPLNDRYMYHSSHIDQCGFLLDLCSHLKIYETETGLRVLPSLQSVFLSAPAVWSINLSERKSSILLEVLKLTSEKKQVRLTGCSHEESEVRSFLQCLPHISQLR